MRDTLMSGQTARSHHLWEAIQTVKVEEAEASVQEDKKRILELIENEIGFHKMNSVVGNCLVEWISSTCNAILNDLGDPNHDDTSLSIAKSTAGVGFVLRDLGETGEALKVLQRARALYEAE